jgi:hypothetical protein
MQSIDVLARNRNPVPIRTQGQVTDRQCGPDQYFFKFAALKREPAHCAVLGTCNEEAILCLQSAVRPIPYFECTYASHNRRVVLLTLVYSNWFIVGSRSENTAVVIDSGCDKPFSGRCVCEVGCARCIYGVQLVFTFCNIFSNTYGPDERAIADLKSLLYRVLVAVWRYDACIWSTRPRKVPKRQGVARLPRRLGTLAFFHLNHQRQPFTITTCMLHPARRGIFSYFNRYL